MIGKNNHYCVLSDIENAAASSYNDASSDLTEDKSMDNVPTFSLDELRKLEDYELGKGAFGIVRAIKGYPKLAMKEIWIKGQPDRLVEIIEFELATIAAASHPGILKYYQVLRNESTIAVIMDRYDWNLEQFIIKYARSHTFIPSELFFSIIEQIVDALSYLHDPNKMDADGNSLPSVVHRDLKPANILINKGSHQIALADFGLCKNAMHNGTTFAGTLAYMAPETLLYNKTGTASDIWALGCIIYELDSLTRPDFLGKQYPKDVFVDTWKPNLSSIRNRFIRQLLEEIFILQPEKRPTAREICEMFQASDILLMKMKLQIEELTVSLSDANTKIISLERDLLTKSNEVNSLKKVLKIRDDEINMLREDIRVNSTRNEDEDNSMLRFIKTRKDLKKIIVQDSSWTQLMRDVVTEDIDMVKRHITKKDINRRNNHGDTALTLAAKLGYRDIVNVLDPIDEDGVTSLMRAAARGDTETVKLLIPLQKGMKDKDGNTAFMYAIRNNHMDTSLVLREPEASSWTPLMYAAFTGDIEVAREYLSEKDKKNKDGDTALILAAKAGHENIIELLDPTDSDGITALMRGSDKGDVETVKSLIPLQKGKQALGKVKVGNISMMNRTALMGATIHGHTDVVNLLVEHEGGLKNDRGGTSLIYAVLTDNINSAKLLLNKEGGLQDNSGWTALMFAAKYNKPVSIHLLLDKEGRKKDNKGWTALMHAAQKNRPECAKLLLEKEVGIKKGNGSTALMVAAANGSTDCVALLLDKEARMQDNWGWTALIWASYYNKPHCVKILMEKEKDIKTSRKTYWSDDNKFYPSGSTALDIARIKSHPEVIKILSD